jgi:hypothetical protein
LKVKKNQTSSVKAAGGIQLAAGGCKWWLVVAFLDLLEIEFTSTQTSLFLVLSTDAFRKMQNVKFLQLNYTSSTEVMNTFPRI